MKLLSFHRVALIAIVFAGAIRCAAGDTSVLRGVVADPAGLPIPRAELVLTGSGGKAIAQATSNDFGQFTFNGLAAGAYSLRTAAPGFRPAQVAVQLGQGAALVQDISMSIAAASQELTVNASAIDPAAAEANLSGVQIDHDLLKSLPVEDGNPLATAALFVDPAVSGAEGVKIVVDGVEASSLDVPASSVKQVYINKNPYSAEFSRPGRGHIDVMTRPGSSNRIHHRATFNFRDSNFDARNAFASTRPPMSRMLSDLEMDGPLPANKGTFYVGGDFLRDNQQAFVRALTPDGPLSTSLSTPERAGHLLARTDWRLTPANTLSMRYAFGKDDRQNEGVGAFDLPERGYRVEQGRQEFRISDLATLAANFTNDLRFAFKRRTNDFSPASTLPAQIVAGAFHAGGSQNAQNSRQDSFELQDVVGVVRGKHVMRAGVTAKHRTFDVVDRSNFGGTFTYASLADFTAGRPELFTQNVGTPAVSFSYMEYSWFAMDEVRLRRDLGLMIGVRQEWQSNLDDHNNLAPRVALSFAPGSGATVFRVGGGIFYDREPAAVQQAALLLDGSHLRQLVVPDPAFIAPPLTVPSVAVSVDRIAAGLRAPHQAQASAAVEHKFGSKTFLSVEYTRVRGLHLLRLRDLNAPLPGTGLRPDPGFTNINQFESGGSARNQSVGVTFRTAFRRLELLSQYAYSRSMDDTAGPFSQPANPFDLGPEWGRSDFDRRHLFRLAGILRMPREVKLGTILSFNSGIPFNIVTGTDDNRDGIVNDRPLGVARNTGSGPGYADVDLRLSRRFKLVTARERPERSPYVEVRLDAFNLLNRVNAVNYVGTLTSPFFGRANAALPARQMQASVKLSF